MKLALTCLLLLFHPWGQQLFAQEPIDISEAGLSKNISGNVSSAYGEPNAANGPDEVKFEPGIRHRGNVPASRVTSPFYLKFHLVNRADSARSVYFFPGFYYKTIRIYRQDEDRYLRLPDRMPDHPDRAGVREISLTAGDSSIFVAGL